jgi:hypothetical protein
MGDIDSRDGIFESVNPQGVAVIDAPFEESIAR